MGVGLIERHTIKTEALIVGYALARMGPKLRRVMHWDTYKEAFEKVAQTLDEKHNSVKNLRDEFDVFFPNGRRGWLNRPPHPSRIAVLREFEGVSDAALVEVVRRILAHDAAALQEVAQIVAQPPKAAANVAERLLTGRLAEEFFIASCDKLIKTPYEGVHDTRQNACGFDFLAPSLGGVAIEVKGLKRSEGGILFTDLEWNVARDRADLYWLVLVGNLDQGTPELPKARVVSDPVGFYGRAAKCDLVVSSSAQWRMQASL